MKVFRVALASLAFVALTLSADVRAFLLLLFAVRIAVPCGLPALLPLLILKKKIIIHFPLCLPKKNLRRIKP
jgi:hypothetical protein